MKSHTLQVLTHRHDELVEITSEVQKIVTDSGVQSGTVIVYVPHTTAGVTINENADPDVKHDFLMQLNLMVPWKQAFYQHMEGNSAAHVKASMMGFDATVLIEDGRMMLGTWQGIYFCEFDGPRNRQCLVKVIEG